MSKGFIDLMDSDEYIKELIREVNKFDKECGLRLKHVEEFADPKQLYIQTAMNCQLYLAKLMATVNGIDATSYFQRVGDMGYIGGPVGIKDPVFIEHSELEWMDNKLYSIDSRIFMKRFLTHLLSFMIGYIEEYAGCRLYCNNVDIDPHAHMYFYVKGLCKEATHLTLSLCEGKNYEDILLVNLFNSNYCIKKVSPEKVKKIGNTNRTILDAVREIRDNMGTNVFNIMTDYPDDQAIYTLIRLAYMLSTRSNNFSELPNFNDLQGATVKHDLVRVIRRLGEVIVDTLKYKKRPVMYRAFNLASPKIMSNYTIGMDDYDLAVGIRALAYTDFIIHDKKVHKFINKMINITGERLE
jgi:hypothetical protein